MHATSCTVLTPPLLSQLLPVRGFLKPLTTPEELSPHSNYETLFAKPPSSTTRHCAVLPQQTRKKALLKHSHFSTSVLGLPCSVHLLATEIQCKMTAQRCPCQLLVFNETLHWHARTALLHHLRKRNPDTVVTFILRRDKIVLILRRHHFQYALLTRDA